MKTSKPLPKPVEMTFPKALEQVIDGKKITRISWDDKRWYGFLSEKDGLLVIHKAGEKDDVVHAWVINKGDLLAFDWVTL